LHISLWNTTAYSNANPVNGISRNSVPAVVLFIRSHQHTATHTAVCNRGHL